MANYNKVKQFENTGILISDWITNKETLKSFDSERFCLAYYSETFKGDTKHYYKIVPKDWLSDDGFKLVSDLSTPIRQDTIYGLISQHYNQQKEENTMKHLTNFDEFLNFLIDKHCDQQKEENTTTVTLFNKTFANATDALIAAIENFDMADANEFEDEGDFIGLSSALNAYAKSKADNTFIFTWLAEIMLGKEIDELTDKIIYKTAWELADHSNFDSVQHPLEIL